MTNGSPLRSPVATVFTLAALTVGWLVMSAVLAYLTLWVGMSAWADAHGGDRSDPWGPFVKPVFLLALAFFVLAPLGIAGTARGRGMRRTAIGYAVLSGLLFLGLIIQFTISPL